MEERRCRTIDEKAKINVGDATHDPFDEIVGEAQVRENHSDVEPICLVECLGKIQFEDDTFDLFVFDRVQHLLYSANCFVNLAMVQKSNFFR